MSIDYQIVRFFQEIRNPILDWFFYIITQLGDQYAFIVIAAIIYWTVNKKYAYQFALSYLGSALVNTVIKEIVKRPRPYAEAGILEPGLPGVTTSGYSFPSGHSQAAGIISHSGFKTAKRLKNKPLFYGTIVFLILVPLSRVYLAQHYFSDIVVGALLGLIIAYYIFKLVDLMGDKEHIYPLIIIPVLVVLMFVIRNEYIYIAAGGFSGFALGYAVEKVYIQYEVKSRLLNQVLKVILGLAIVLLIKDGLKLFLPDNYFTDFVRYFLIGLWAAAGAPWVFKHVFKK